MLHQPQLAGQPLQPRARACQGRHQRQAHCIAAPAHQAQHGLHRPGVRLPEVRFEQPRIAPFQLPRLAPVVVQRCAHHLRHFRRSLVRRHADQPVRPTAIAASARLSSPEKILNPRGMMCASSANCDTLPLASLIASMFLAAAASRAHSLRLQVRRRPSRHVVHANRAADPPRAPTPESAGTAPPAWACCNRDSPRARTPRPARARDRRLSNQHARRVVRAPGPHRNPSRRRIDHQPNRAQPLFFVQRRRFARRPACQQKIDSRFNLPVHQRPQRRLVH